MKVEYLNCHYSRYATTNPPVSETREFKFYYPDGAAVLEKYSYCNGTESVKRYKVSAEQENELLKLLEEINIPDLIEKELNKPVLPDMSLQMCGGSSSNVFCVSIDGKEAVFKEFTDEINSVINKMNGILNNCVEPFLEESKGEPAPVFGIGMAVPPVQQQPPQKNETASDGEWKCPTCGYAHNTGIFCSECGTPK